MPDISFGRIFAPPQRNVPTRGDELRERMRRFAVRVLAFVRTLARDPATDTVARQLARAGGGVSSNYHSACRGRSRAEFIARLGVALDEADEACHWLLALKESGIANGPELDWLSGEGAELRAILYASVSTARRNKRRWDDGEDPRN
jgi:four helix bundle protein